LKRTLLSLLPSLITGCAVPLARIEPPGPPDRFARRIDWEAAGREAARLLSEYLRIDTRNPPGNESEGARYLAARLREAGIDSELVELAPGRGSLIARLRGSGAEPPLCLLSHIDVAEARAEEWPQGRGPLSGTIDAQGVVWGRGALDMKGMGILELQTMIWLKRLEVPLRRDVILLAVADEEVGNQGMRELADKHWGRIACSHLVNEGGLGIKDAMFRGQTVFGVSVAEKGVLWLRMIARGEGGHGSTPRPDQAPDRLVRALTRLAEREPAVRFHPSIDELLARAGAQRGGLAGFVLARPALVHGLLRGKLTAKPGGRALLTDTINVTGLDTGGNQPNVVPGRATARLDVRLLPGTRPEAVLAELHELVDDPAIDFEQILYYPSLESPSDDPFFRALARHAVGTRRDAAAGPLLSVGFTDSLFARQKGARAYGLVPFEVTEEEAATMHGVGERVSTSNLRDGLRILLGAVLEVAAVPER
jgi:acetylornithine deacetylase/succinyl-diaminopimelate desuccinylase-like protein